MGLNFFKKSITKKSQSKKKNYELPAVYLQIVVTVTIQNTIQNTFSLEMH